MIHLATIPVDNTSVNPARSFGAAIFSGADALGAALGVLRVPDGRRCRSACSIWLLVHDSSLEETMLGSRRMIATRDSMRSAAHRVEDRLQ